ncbi:MAG: Uracil-DNA glycosylase, partial [Caulobacteraceae bacterium]|nr:Uracil-DNA glycosylase [Caulobacteraceae bacterium]
MDPVSTASSDNLALDPRALESLLAFWSDAGADAVLLETPVDRLAEGQRPPPRPAISARAPAAPQ